MAEVIGLTTGLVALGDYGNQSRNVRVLKQELEALIDVLRTLQDTAKSSRRWLGSTEIAK